MKLRRLFWITPTLAVVVVAIGWLAQHGCAGPDALSPRLKPTSERSQKLTALSAEEAGLIPDLDVRLTRQLNIADQQISRGWKNDAIVTLAGAKKTLVSDDAHALGDHARVSGWVSISELSRQVRDTSAASFAGERAVDGVLAIKDFGKRCEYVIGVANELQFARSISEAAKFVTDSGPWTKGLESPVQRRRALVGFASVLFNLDDYTGGQKMLRYDDDVAWRTDTLASLAAMQEVTGDQSLYTNKSSAPQAVMEQQTGAAIQASPTPEESQPFGRSLDYRSVFQNQKNSQTVKD